MRSGRLKSSGDADDKDEDEDEDAAWLPRAMSLKSCEAMPGRKLRQRVSTSRREGARRGGGRHVLCQLRWGRPLRTPITRSTHGSCRLLCHRSTETNTDTRRGCICGGGSPT